MYMNYKVKRVQYADLADYMQVNCKAWQESYKGILNDKFLSKLAVDLEEYIKRQQEKFDKQEENGIRKFLLFVEDKPVGMMSVGPSRLQEFSSLGELCSLYLLNKVKKKGYGKVLFQEAIKQLKEMGYHEIVIGCLALNLSNAFYRHMGAQFVKDRIIRIGEQDLKENIYILKI